jgi:hypothetical protein
MPASCYALLSIILKFVQPANNAGPGQLALPAYLKKLVRVVNPELLSVRLETVFGKRKFSPKRPGHVLPSLAYHRQLNANVARGSNHRKLDQLEIGKRLPFLS